MPRERAFFLKSEGKAKSQEDALHFTKKQKLDRRNLLRLCSFLSFVSLKTHFFKGTGATVWPWEQKLTMVDWQIGKEFILGGFPWPDILVVEGLLLHFLFYYTEMTLHPHLIKPDDINCGPRAKPGACVHQVWWQHSHAGWFKRRLQRLLCNHSRAGYFR